MNRFVKKPDQRGDTIIEVLIAIAIVSFALGTAYAMASRNLQQGINARERIEALNLLEGQINALKFRQQKTAALTFVNRFAFNNNDNRHFCLNDTALSPSAGAAWDPIVNNINRATNTSTAPLTSGGAPGQYNINCVRNNKYYLNIETIDRTSPTNPSPVANLNVPITYKFTVRWERLGGGPNNETSIYYRF